MQILGHLSKHYIYPSIGHPFMCLTHFLVIPRMLCRVTPGNMRPSREGVASSSTGKEYTEHNQSEELPKQKKEI